MTVTQYAYQLLRHCQPNDPAKLTAGQQQELLAAMSIGMGTFFDEAPQELKRTTGSIALPAPLTTSITLTKGSTKVSSTPFTSAQRGSAIAIEGDSRTNEITATNKLLQPYTGTSGSHSATIYGDCIPVHSRQIERMVSDPWLIHTGGGTQRLVRAPFDHDMEGQAQPWWGWRGSLQLGYPHWYAIQQTGASQASDANFLLRIYPAPNKETVIRFQMSVAPNAYTMADLTAEQPEDIALSDDRITRMVIPLAERELLGSSMWHGDERKDRRIEQSAERAERLIKKIPPETGTPNHRAGTPYGW